MLIVPAIDIIAGKVVRLEQGDFQKVSTYALSPLGFAEKWASEGATFIHVVDLDGAKAGAPKNFELIKEIIKKVRVKIEIGGGIRSLKSIKRYLEVGADRVVLSTKVIEDASFLLSPKIKDYVAMIAVSMDIKHMDTAEFVTGGTGGWLQSADALIDTASFVRLLVQAGIRYLNFSDIAKDGTLTGPDTGKIQNFIKCVRESSSGEFFLSYAGGISSLDDIKKLKSLGPNGVDAVIVGRALYENKFSLKEAIEIAK